MVKQYLRADGKWYMHTAQGRTQDFPKGRARAEIVMNSGQWGAKNKSCVSYLLCYRLPRSFHIAKSFKTRVAKTKIA